MKLFLDTGGLLAVLDRSDENHSECSDFWRKMLTERTYEPVISDYVLDELVTRVRYDISHNKALQILSTLMELVRRGRLKLIWVNQDYFSQARSIFERYNDQEFSFTDCTSFAICEEERIQYVFALDRDFQIFGLNLFPTGDGS